MEAEDGFKTINKQRKINEVEGRGWRGRKDISMSDERRKDGENRNRAEETNRKLFLPPAAQCPSNVMLLSEDSTKKKCCFKEK